MCKDEVRLGAASTTDNMNYFNPAPFLFKRKKNIFLMPKGENNHPRIKALDTTIHKSK